MNACPVLLLVRYASKTTHFVNDHAKNVGILQLIHRLKYKYNAI